MLPECQIVQLNINSEEKQTLGAAINKWDDSLGDRLALLTAHQAELWRGEGVLMSGTSDR